MSKVNTDDIKALGFTPEMFGLADDASLDIFIQPVIDDASAMLKGILGASLYDSTTQPVAYQVKRAEACLVAGELMQRRINRILGNVTGAGEEINTRNESKQLDRYRIEAENLIAVLTGDTSDAIGINTSSHFDETSELGGLEVC